MSLLCLHCYEIYDTNIQLHKSEYEHNNEKHTWTFCPKSSCHGRVVEIDELMLPIIKTLNQKGYTTAYCCSGHIWSNKPNCYISFDTEIRSLPHYPVFYDVEHNERLTIRQNFEAKDEHDLHRMILSNIICLSIWTEALPVRKE